MLPSNNQKQDGLLLGNMYSLFQPGFGSAWPSLAGPGSGTLDLACLGSSRLGTARPSSSWLDLTQLGSAQPGPGRVGQGSKIRASILDGNQDHRAC